jgi:hypothetical protein
MEVLKNSYNCIRILDQIANRMNAPSSCILFFESNPFWHAGRHLKITGSFHLRLHTPLLIVDAAYFALTLNCGGYFIFNINPGSKTLDDYLIVFGKRYLLS